MKKDYSGKWLRSHHNHNWDVIDEVGGLSVYDRLDIPRLREAGYIYLRAPLYVPELREVGEIHEYESDEWYGPKLERVGSQVFESGKCLVL